MHPRTGVTWMLLIMARRASTLRQSPPVQRAQGQDRTTPQELLQALCLLLCTLLAEIAWLWYLGTFDHIGMWVDTKVYDMFVAPSIGQYVAAATLAKSFEFLPPGAPLKVSSIPGVYTEQNSNVMEIEANAIACGAEIALPGHEHLLPMCARVDAVSIRTFSTCGRPKPPKDLDACAKSKVWGHQDIILHIGGKVLGYVFGQSHVLKWSRMSLDVKPSQCRDAARRQLMRALAGGVSSMTDRLTKRGEHSMRGKFGIGVHLPKLIVDGHTDRTAGFSWDVVGMLSARDLVAMLHASHWNTLPLRATSDVREVPAPTSLGAVEVDTTNRNQGLVWHEEVGPEARVAAHDPAYERFKQRLDHSLQLLCPAHMPQFPHAEQHYSVHMLKKMASWLGLSANKTQELMTGCALDAGDVPTQVRMSVAWLQVIDYPLLALKPGEAEECQQAAATWQHFRSLTLAAHGVYHTVPSDAVSWVRQHGAAATAADGVSDRSFVRVCATPSVSGSHLIWLTSVVLFAELPGSTQATNLQNVHVQMFSPLDYERQHTMSWLAQSDILVTVSNPRPDALVSLPPWGGVLELVGSELPAETSMAQAMAHRLGLAHMQVQPDRVEAATKWMLALPGRVIVKGRAFRPFAHAIFAAVLEEMVVEVRRRRRAWLQEHAAGEARGGARGQRASHVFPGVAVSATGQQQRTTSKM